MKIKIEYFTDPLCAWSYASEPSVEALVRDYGDKIDLEFRALPILDRIMGEPKPGEKMKTPEELHKEWSDISRKTGTKIDPGIWQENPPYSSWPANRAMKAALRQGFEKGYKFVHSLRKAVMLERRNPSNLENLKEIASQSGLDAEQFHRDMTENAFEVEQEVASDRMEAMERCITSTPTLVMQNEEGDQVILVGTLDLEMITRAIRSLKGEKVIGAPVGEIAPSM